MSGLRYSCARRTTCLTPAQKVKNGIRKKRANPTWRACPQDDVFCERLLLGDQNLFGRDGSLSQFDILLRSLRRAIRQFHTKIGQVHRSNKADATTVFDGQLTGVAFIALVGHGREDEGTAVRSLEEYPPGHRRGTQRESVVTSGQ